MVGELESTEERGTIDSLVLTFRGAGTFETVVFKRIVPGDWRVLFADSLVVEIYFFRR